MRLETKNFKDFTSGEMKKKFCLANKFKYLQFHREPIYQIVPFLQYELALLNHLWTFFQNGSVTQTRH